MAKSHLNTDLWHDDWIANFELAYLEAIKRNDHHAVIGMEDIMIENFGYSDEQIEAIRQRHTEPNSSR